MMNVVAIFLVVTSLAAAGVWSPSPTASLHQAADNVIVKDGHRVVVVEYDRDGHANTKVSISPDDNAASTSSLNEKHKGSHGPGFAAKELICDAYGKCKHVISSTVGKARDEAAARVHEVEAEAREAKESVSQKAHDAKERTKEKFEGAKDEAREAKESVSQKAHDAKERIEEHVDRAKEGAKEVISDAAEKGREAKETAKGRLNAVAHRVKEMGRKLLASQALTLTYLMGLVNLLGFVTAYGMCTWVTFISSYVLAQALPRQQFALVQSKMYPVYFRTMVYSVGAALLGHLLSQRRRLFSDRTEMLQGYNLLASLLMVSFNMLYLEPRATKVMFERMKLEKEEGRGRELFSGEPGRGPTNESSPTRDTPASAAAAAASGGGAAAAPAADSVEEAALWARTAKLSERLKGLNSYSSLLNILTLMSLSWHLVYLGQRLSQTC